ncbi:TPA: hypothetical protein ACTYZB_004859 [Klebsiella variicola]
MNNSKRFNSQIHEIAPFAQGCSNSDIKNEPMFFNCGLDYAWDNGGPITRSFILNLPDGWSDAVFDSRVHMLIPGWYPAIPGFHHDDVPRPDIPTGQHFLTAGQPDYDNPRYLSEHILGLVNADICPTHFALGECTMPKIQDGELIYRRWHNEVEKLIERGEMKRVTIRDRMLTAFDWQTFHTGEKAIHSGWRWFGRVSRNTERTKKITNEIRVNAQVYLEFPTQGW